jgi:hypothetical protein
MVLGDNLPPKLPSRLEVGPDWEIRVDLSVPAGSVIGALARLLISLVEGEAEASLPSGTDGKRCDRKIVNHSRVSKKHDGREAR